MLEEKLYSQLSQYYLVFRKLFVVTMVVWTRTSWTVEKLNVYEFESIYITCVLQWTDTNLQVQLAKVIRVNINTHCVSHPIIDN